MSAMKLYKRPQNIKIIESFAANHREKKAEIESEFYSSQNIQASLDVLTLFGFGRNEKQTIVNLQFLRRVRRVFSDADIITVRNEILFFINDFDFARDIHKRRLFLQLYITTMYTNSCLNRAKSTLDNFFANGANSSEIKNLKDASNLTLTSFRMMFVGQNCCLVDDPRCGYEICEYCECFWVDIKNLPKEKLSKYYSLALFESNRSKIKFDKKEFSDLPEYMRIILYHRFDVTLV